MAKLLDTSFLIAYHNEDDEFHERARELEIDDEKVINDYIFTEVLNILYSRRGKQKAVEYSKFLEKRTKRIMVSEPIFRKAARNFQEKDLSFTDASIAATAQKLDMEIVSFDEDFDQFEEINRIH
ncbi:MAG: type II toxin-antitoxin system VapC family toxin [Candidatus Nanohalobium sp.]